MNVRVNEGHHDLKKRDFGGPLELESYNGRNDEIQNCMLCFIF